MCPYLHFACNISSCLLHQHTPPAVLTHRVYCYRPNEHYEAIALQHDVVRSIDSSSGYKNYCLDCEFEHVNQLTNASENKTFFVCDARGGRKVALREVLC